MVNAARRRELIRLARKGNGQVSPNPLVGALLVKNNKIVGRGYHPFFGGPHAEVMAIEEAGRKAAQGAKLYVSLEPCSHFGKTPPCADLIVKSGIREVWVGMIDPNPLVTGQGIARLQEAGIVVEVAEDSEEFAALNRAYVKYITEKLPWVLLKNALTLDGRINDQPQYLSGEKSRRLVHRWRASYDAVGVGVNTVIRDDPLLNVRSGKTPGKKVPLRVIFDSRGRTPVNARLFSKGKAGGEVVIFTTARAPAKNLEKLRQRGATIFKVAESDGKVNLRAALKKLAAKKKVSSILVEGGPTLNAALLEAKLACEVAFFVTPSIWGSGRGISVVGKGLHLPLTIEKLKTSRVGQDILISGKIKYK